MEYTKTDKNHSTINMVKNSKMSIFWRCKMKKIKLLIVLSILLFSFASCKSEKAENIVNETEDIVSKQNNDNKLNDIDDISQEKDKNNEINVFKKLPQNFVFSSGVGNWSTTFDLSPDRNITFLYFSCSSFRIPVYICIQSFTDNS